MSMNASRAATIAGLENPASIQWARSVARETAAVGLAMSSPRTMTAKVAHVPSLEPPLPGVAVV